MPRNLKTIDINPGLYEKVKEKANELGVSIRVFVEDILREAVEGGKAKDKPDEFIKIVLRFDTKCRDCGKELRKGQIGYWLKGYGVICPDCHLLKQLEGLGDSSLAKKYLKAYELRKVVQGLQKQADKLAQVILEAEKTVSGLNELRRIQDQLRSLIANASLYFRGDPQKLEELTTTLRDISTKLDQITTFMPKLVRETKEKLAQVREGLF